MGASAAEPLERWVRANGLRLRYLDWGSEAAPPLVLLHGWMSNADVWRRVAGAFRGSHRALAA